MSVLSMYKFGTQDDAICKASWLHNAKGADDFLCKSFDDMQVEEGYFIRYETMLKQARMMPPKMRLSYLDNDAVHLRRQVALRPNLNGRAIGAVRTDSPRWPFNCGAIYAETGPDLVQFLECLLSHKEDCLKIGDNHADEHAFARAAEEYPHLVASLDPAWNDWARAAGERLIPTVVQAFHSMPMPHKLEAVKATVELSQKTWPI